MTKRDCPPGARVFINDVSMDQASSSSLTMPNPSEVLNDMSVFRNDLRTRIRYEARANSMQTGEGTEIV